MSTIHKRLKILEEDDIITCYTARPSIQALNSIPLVIIGRSRSSSMQHLKQEIGKHETVFGIAVASGNILYVSIMLRNIGQLQEITDFVTTTAKLEEVIVGIVAEPYSDQLISLSPIELRIIKSINRDARKSYTDIAADIGSSAKTVRRYLETMMEENKLSCSIEWAPLYTESFVSIFHIEVEGLIQEELEFLAKTYRENLVIVVAFANVPNFILLEIWTKSPRESQELLEELQRRNYREVVPHILMSIEWYPNWMDELVDAAA